MEQINIQANNLKLNVSNIKSFLIDSNKKTATLRSQKNSLLTKSIEKKKFRGEEKRIESSLKLGSITRIGQSIAKKGLSFFDKLKEFFGLILVGFLINKLPSIIRTVQKFFTDNPWIGNTIKFVLDIIGKGFSGIISIVDFFTTDKRSQIEKDNKNLEREFINLGGELDKDIANLGKITEEELPSEEKIGTLPISPDQDSSSPKGPAFQPITPLKIEGKKFQTGGKIKPSSSSRSSVKEKTAYRTTEYFSNFRKNYITSAQVNDENEKNREKFEKIVENLKVIYSSMPSVDQKKKPMHSPASSRSSSPSAGSQIFDGLPDSTIVGRVGFTGNTVPRGPAGAHIHIETGSGRGDGYGPVPSDIFNKVIVGGRPLSQWPYTSGYGRRWGKLHKGHDFGISAGNPIQLHKDLKLVEYAPGNNAGYGNLIMFKDKNGNTYIITHLQSGPESAQRSNAQSSSAGTKDGKGGAIVPISTSYKIGEDEDDEDVEVAMVVQPMIIRQKTPVLLPFG